MSHKRLWIGALLASAADVATTWIGLTMFGGREGNPIVATAIGATGPLTGLIGMKLIALVVSLALYTIASDDKWLVPSVLTVVFGVAAVSNALQILGAL